MRAVDLRCFVTGGGGGGLGHVMRALTVAEEARRRGWSVAFHLRGDAAAAALVDDAFPRAVQAWQTADDAAAAAGWTLFDTREPIAAELARARSAGARRLVLDRVDHLDDADLTVLPHLHAPRLAHPQVRQGAAYCLVPREIRAAASLEAATRSCVLVSFGGSDPLGLTRLVSRPLARALRAQGAPWKVDCVLGRCFRATRRLLDELRELGWHVHVDLGHREMAALMRRAHFALTGFGTTVYELAHLGVPPLYVTHHRDDRDAAERLEREGVGALLAEGPDFDADVFLRRLGETALDAGWRRAVSARCRDRLGAAQGASRILDALAEHGRPDGRTEERTP